MRHRLRPHRIRRVRTVVSTARGPLIEVVDSLTDLAEWPEHGEMMTNKPFDVICSIADQAEKSRSVGTGWCLWQTSQLLMLGAKVPSST